MTITFEDVTLATKSSFLDILDEMLFEHGYKHSYARRVGDTAVEIRRLKVGTPASVIRAIVEGAEKRSDSICFTR